MAKVDMQIPPFSPTLGNDTQLSLAEPKGPSTEAHNVSHQSCIANTSLTSSPIKKQK